MATRNISILVGREPRAFTRSVEDLIVPRDTLTSLLTTGGAYSMLWGYTVGTNGGGSVGLANYNRIAAFLGPAEVIRDFYPGTTIQWPPKNGAYQSLSPQPLFIQSWKPNYTQVLNGSQDSYIRSHLAKLPTNRITCIGAWHEWDVKYFGNEGNGPNTITHLPDAPQSLALQAQFQNYLADLVHDFGNPMIKFAPILGAHNYQSRWNSMLNAGMDTSKYDYVLYDPYRAGSPGGYGYANGYNQINVMGAYLRDVWGMPTNRQGIAEIGVGTTQPQPDQYPEAAEYARGAITKALEYQYWCCCWFESGTNSYMLGNPPASGPTLTDRPQIRAVWSALRAANP